MKITKSKQELARIISENGGWRDGNFSVICRGGEVLNSSNKPFYDTKHGWCCGGGFGDNRFTSDVVAKNWHQTILSREEYFHLYPAPDAKPQFCDSVMRSIPEPEINSKNINITQVDDINVVESKPTIEQLAADYRNAKDYAERKQQEADDAKADAGAKLAELVAAGKALGLVLGVADAAPVTTKFTGKFHSAKYGDRPSDLDMICDGCGKRFGTHVGFDCRP